MNQKINAFVWGFLILSWLISTALLFFFQNKSIAIICIVSVSAVYFLIALSIPIHDTEVLSKAKKRELIRKKLEDVYSILGGIVLLIAAFLAAIYYYSIFIDKVGMPVFFGLATIFCSVCIGLLLNWMFPSIQQYLDPFPD